MKTVRIGSISEAAVPEAAPTNTPLMKPASIGKIKSISRVIYI